MQTIVTYAYMVFIAVNCYFFDLDIVHLFYYHPWH